MGNTSSTVLWIDVHKATVCACVSITDAASLRSTRCASTPRRHSCGNWRRGFTNIKSPSCDGGDRSVLETRLEPAGGRVRVAVGQSAASEIDSWQERRTSRTASESRTCFAARIAARQFRSARPIRELRDLTRMRASLAQDAPAPSIALKRPWKIRI